MTNYDTYAAYITQQAQSLHKHFFSANKLLENIRI
jgi:hypothetical protein